MTSTANLIHLSSPTLHRRTLPHVHQEHDERATTALCSLHCSGHTGGVLHDQCLPRRGLVSAVFVVRDEHGIVLHIGQWEQFKWYQDYYHKTNAASSHGSLLDGVSG
jgi:hypothetical protein